VVSGEQFQHLPFKGQKLNEINAHHTTNDHVSKTQPPKAKKQPTDRPIDHLASNQMRTIELSIKTFVMTTAHKHI
jgi:hypothetical protein